MTSFTLGSLSAPNLTRMGKAASLVATVAVMVAAALAPAARAADNEVLITETFTCEASERGCG